MTARLRRTERRILDSLGLPTAIRGEILQRGDPLDRLLLMTLCMQIASASLAQTRRARSQEVVWGYTIGGHGRKTPGFRAEAKSAIQGVVRAVERLCAVLDALDRVKFVRLGIDVPDFGIEEALPHLLRARAILNRVPAPAPAEIPPPKSSGRRKETTLTLEPGRSAVRHPELVRLIRDELLNIQTQRGESGSRADRRDAKLLAGKIVGALLR
jgi:hypothetical protein